MHATCVDVNGSGVLIVGHSGSGKSSLAINLLALGSKLVADDQCALVKKNKKFRVFKPASLPNSIEIRGVGLVSVPLVVETSLDWSSIWTKLKRSVCQICDSPKLMGTKFRQFLVGTWTI